MQNSNTTLGVTLAAAAVFAVALGVWLMQPAYGKISQEACDYALALASACGRKDSATVEKIQQEVRIAAEEGRLSELEAGYLLSIAEKALAEDWETAYGSARKLLLRQTETVAGAE